MRLAQLTGQGRPGGPSPGAGLSGGALGRSSSHLPEDPKLQYLKVRPMK